MDPLTVFMNQIKNYPFNLELPDNISIIKLKLSNTSIILTDKDIISNLPIFIKYKDNILFVWNTEQNPIKIEQSYQDEITYLDFDNNKIKAWPIYHFTYWLIPKITKLDKILLIGNNNKIEINGNIINKSNIIIEGIDNILEQK